MLIKNLNRAIILLAGVQVALVAFAKSDSESGLETQLPSIVAAAASAEPKVDVRHLPDRMDDFCWENPFCAMRAYGPKLAMPAPEGQGFSSSGIDVFNKGVADTVLVDTIRRAMDEGWSYHTPNRRCFDSYTVGAGRGCGGIARRGADGVIGSDGNWIEQHIIEKTSGRCV